MNENWCCCITEIKPAQARGGKRGHSQPNRAQRGEDSTVSAQKLEWFQGRKSHPSRPVGVSKNQVKRGGVLLN